MVFQIVLQVLKFIDFFFHCFSFIYSKLFCGICYCFHTIYWMELVSVLELCSPTHKYISDSSEGSSSWKLVCIWPLIYDNHYICRNMLLMRNAGSFIKTKFIFQINFRKHETDTTQILNLKS